MAEKWLESPAEEVVNAAIETLAEPQDIWLATVVSTWGSSPRPPGSMMLWSARGGLVGSVSGGCVEEDLIQKFQACVHPEEHPSVIVYGADDAEAKALRLPCGGKLYLLIEALHKRNNLDLWHSLAKKLKQRQGCLRSVDLASGNWQLSDSAPQALRQSDTEIAIYLGPSHKLLIIGANQIASYLASFAQVLNFSVTVCDPGELTANALSAEGLRYLQRYPDGLVSEEFNDSASAVVAVSHDPRLDDMALLEALPGQAFYVGAMGSKRTSDARRQRLLQLGLTEKEMARLKAPIGLDIGSKSPAEIAVSIAADLIRASKMKNPT